MTRAQDTLNSACPVPWPCISRRSSAFPAARNWSAGGRTARHTACRRSMPRERAARGFWDVDGFEYIDWISGIGSILLGYADPVVDEAVCRQIARGTVYAVNHELEIELAEELCQVDSLRRDGPLRQVRRRGLRDRRADCARRNRPRQGAVLRLSRLARLVPGRQPGGRGQSGRAPVSRHRADRRAARAGRHGAAVCLWRRSTRSASCSTSIAAKWRR